MTLLGACRTHKDVELAKKISDQILGSYFDQETRASTYIAMANIYGKVGLVKKQKEMLNKLDEEGLRKKIGKVWIKTPFGRYVFVANEKNHPQIDKIIANIEELRKEFLIKYKEEFGEEYVPDLSYAPNYETEEEKIASLWRHSGKICFSMGINDNSKRSTNYHYQKS